MENPRKYGHPPFRTAVLHGGPGAPGEMAPVACELSKETGILEPLQTASTVEGQLRELKIGLCDNCDLPATLIGWSWGAWLAFIFSARFPAYVRKLILISAGPFREEYVKDIMDARFSRMTDMERVNVLSIMKGLNDPHVHDKDELLSELGGLMRKTDSYDLISFEEEAVHCSYDIFSRVWEEAGELRRSGRLLEYGEMIQCPVVTLHGDHDPHPAEGVRVPLRGVLADFTFHLLENCGHYPWLERGARERFFEILRDEIR